MRSRLALLIIGLAALACARRGSIDTRAPVILISIDTLRSDHLPAYGYTRIETPAFDAFRKDSILYEHAYAQCPLTLVSHATIFTGRLPADHGIRDNMGYELKKNVPTLAEIMKSKGYATGAAVSAVVLRGETEIKRGFDFWDDDVAIDPNYLSMGRAQRNGDETREIAQKWITEHKSQPFFFFFHIYEPHTPYDPPEPFRSRYGATYDGDVAAADAIVGRFLAFLRDEGIYDRATIILLSDHGEGLGDHGEDEHGILLYREALQVPLMLKLSGSREHGKSVETPVGLTDVFPTFADAFGVPQKTDGQSLLTALRGKASDDRKLYAETYYPRFHFGWSDMHSLISGSRHYIQSPRPELFDLSRDPGEKTNKLLEERRTYVALRNAIEPFIKTAEAPKSIDPEQARQLAALGYVGSTASTSSGVALPDPKDHISSSAKIKKGFLAFQEKHYEEAAKIFADLLHENSNMLDIWSIQARTMAKLGRLDEALAAGKEGLRLSPSSVNLALTIATVALEANRLDDAENHARLAVREAPNEAHALLGEVALLRKDYRRAAAEADAVLGVKRDRPVALMILGRISMGEGRLDEALRRFDEAARVLEAKHQPSMPKLNYFRGDTLARMGRSDEAEAAFRKEIEKYPSDPAPYKNLLLLYALEGRTDAATELIYSLEKASPTVVAYRSIAETLKTIGDTNGARFWAARGLRQFPSDATLRRLAQS